MSDDSKTSSPTSPSSPSRPAGLRREKSLTLDLSNLPPLQQPTPPSNTLLFTNLQQADVFRPENLQTIRELVEKIAPVHSWAPLRSFRRIIASFFSEEAAVAVRAAWDGEAVLGVPCHVYFGRPTPLDLDSQDTHLALPDAGKLFFISPPPSPPHDWQMRLEGAPNKQVHAEDLAEALAHLHRAQRDPAAVATIDSPVSPVDGEPNRRTRSRSSTLVIYQPEDHGSNSDLPAIAVEDTTQDPEDEDKDDYASPAESPTRPIMAHTARPPVELMNDA